MESDSLTDEEVLIFSQFLYFVNCGYTLRDIAKRMHRSTGYLSELTAKVESQRYGDALTARGRGTGGRLTLTNVGRSVLEKALNVLPQEESTSLKVATSHSLVTNQIINPAISEFLASPKETPVKIDLTLKTALRFELLLDELNGGLLDIAFVWGGRETRNLCQSYGCQVKPLGSPFNLVVVCNQESLANEIDSVISSSSFWDGRNMNVLKSVMRILIGRRAAKLEKHQPLDSLFASSSDPVIIDTYDAVQAVVSSGVADYGIVPACYSRLERAKVRGELFFSLPIGKLEVIEVRSSRLAPGSVANALSLCISKCIGDAVIRYTAPVERVPMPSCLLDIRRVKYAYYIDFKRESGVCHSGASSKGNQSIGKKFLWHSEKIAWKEEIDGQLHGMIENCVNEKFRCTAKITNAGCVIEASAEGKCVNKRSVQSFVTILTQAFESPFRLVGVWTTVEQDERLKEGALSKAGGRKAFMPPTYVFATVYSECPLSLHDLRNVQQSSNRSILAVDNSIEGFDCPSGSTQLG